MIYHLTSHEKMAIRELANWVGEYRFRHITMKKLVSMGLVEECHSKDAASFWVLTDDGRQWLLDNA